MNDTDEESHVVTAFLRNGGEVLLLRRSDAVGTYSGHWGGVSGYAEGDPDAQVRTEIREETGLDSASTPIRSGRPVEFEDPDLGRSWVVHPFLFEVPSRDVSLSEEHDVSEWVHPTAILDDRRNTVPELWTAYERVGPTVRSIAADDDHGAAWLSIRALEVLRDRAGLLVSERVDEIETADSETPTSETADSETPTSETGGSRTVDSGDEWDELAELARRLLEARPSMAVLGNRVNRAMAGAAADAGGGDVVGTDAGGKTDETGTDPVSEGTEAPNRSAPAVLETTRAGIERAIEADEGATTIAQEYVTGTVLTLSRSGTVLETLRRADPDRIFVAESRPACEGTAVAEALAADESVSAPVTVHTDGAGVHVLDRMGVDAVLVGADTVLPDGRVVNKTGTRAIALAATHEEIPVYVITAADKISTREEVNLESGAGRAIYDGDAPVDVLDPTFDVTPAECVAGFVTERGVLSTDEVGQIADRLREFETWRAL